MMLRSHLLMMHLLIRRMWSVSGASSSPGSFAGVHFGLVSASGSHVALIFGPDLVRMFSGTARPLRMMFSYVACFVFSFSRSCRSTKSFCAAFALPRIFVE